MKQKKARLKFHPSKIVLSFVVTMIAFVTLTASTLAWLSVAREVYVDDFALGVKATSVLEISLDGINYHSEITTEQLNAIFAENFRFSLVTTRDNENFTFLDEGVTHQPAKLNKDYISFPLWFRTSDIYLKGLFLSNNIGLVYSYDAIVKMVDSGKKLGATYFVSQGVQWSNLVEFDNGGDVPLPSGTVDTYHAQNAMRIGITEQNVDLDFLHEPDVRPALEKMIYDPSENAARGYGVPHGAIDYFEQIKKIKLNVPTPPLTKYQLSVFKNPYEARNADSKIATFQLGIQDGMPFGFAKVNINIWIEGWDADAFDAIASDKILMQLHFQCANLT